MYVCICNGVTDKQIKAEVQAGANSLEDLQESLGVATCCGACKGHACSYLQKNANVSALAVSQQPCCSVKESRVAAAL